MFTLTATHQYYLYNGFTDMRKNFDGLCGLVQGCMHRNPMSGEVFLFINRRRDRIKLLHWERGGFVLYYKRLESGTLEIPRCSTDGTYCQMIWSDLVLMIEGISLQYIRQRKRFTTLSPK